MLCHQRDVQTGERKSRGHCKMLLPCSHRTSAVVSSEKKMAGTSVGGWKSMPYILGNETCERLASFGLVSNFMVFLTKEFGMEQFRATTIINIWSALASFAPIIGAFVSDAYAGKFTTIAVASFASLAGMLCLTLTAWIPELRPPPCVAGERCVGPNASQLTFLLVGLGFLTVGTGGIRPCNLPFGVDQFNSTTASGRRGISRFYNWYYTSFTFIIIVAMTVVVYVQNSVSWVLGFGIPTLVMFFSILLFFLGYPLYVIVKPEGSVFSGIVQVVVASYRKRRLELNAGKDGAVELYDPSLKKSSNKKWKLPLTDDYRMLSKAAIVVEGDVNTEDGTASNSWRLCSIQQIEELKCILRILPLWASGIVCFTSLAQQNTYTVSQALAMDRRLGPSFRIPGGSITVISMLTVAVWLPFYDTLVVPRIKHFMKTDAGVTVLRRMGAGLVFSVLSMVVAGVVEEKRRSAALAGHPPISVFWLTPQLVLMGFTDCHNAIAQMEFYNREFPENMTSVGNAMFSLTIAGANYLSSALAGLVHGFTGKKGRPDWLNNDINRGRLDYYYYMIAGMGFLNFLYFLVCSSRFRYKSEVQLFNEDVEEE